MDTPAGLYEAPRSRAVASFIGNMNFFRGTVWRNGSAMAAIEAEGLGILPMPVVQVAMPDGAPVQIALRPEKFSLSRVRPDSAHAVEGHLRTAAYLGERSHYYLSMPGKADPIAVSTQNTNRPFAAQDEPNG
ncbi:TOBE domain-containing protein [Roseovarius sp.]|uniref:TOBE domain-containing protein n=1 Tax=Roseovarius sp. TaxID=1486281 RepID=UPI003A984B28